MTDENPAPPISKKKYLLIVAAILAVFYTVAPTLLGGVLAVLYPSEDVAYDTALRARITDTWMNRQYYLYYLNGDKYKMHDFNSFVAADSAARRGMNDTLGYDPSTLSHYLRTGDSLFKAAQSPRLTVRRGPATTHWILYKYTPEGRQPVVPQRRVVVVDSDTLELR